MMKYETTATVTTKPYLTNTFHHDRGRFVFAVSPRRGEECALGCAQQIILSQPA